MLIVQNKPRAEQGETASNVIMLDRASILLQKLDVSLSDRFLIRLGGIFSSSAEGNVCLMSCSFSWFCLFFVMFHECYTRCSHRYFC